MKYCYFLFLLLLELNQVHAQVNLSSGLTACYALNGNAAEPISGLTGTMIGTTPTSDRFNNPNSAMYFSGQGQFIELPDNPLLKPSEAISFSCWINGTRLSNFYILYTKNSLNTNFEAYELCVEPNLTFMTRKVSPAGLNQVNSITPYVTNTWFHLVFTIDDSFVKLYVNGQLEGSTPTTFSGFDYVQGKKVILGASNEWYDVKFKGSMDNARFYNRTLNAAEVQALYNTDPACITSMAPVAAIRTPSTVCAGTTVQFTDVSTNAPNQWTWTMPGSSSPVSNLQHPLVTYTLPGTYTFSMVSSNAGGNSTVANTITVLPTPPVTAATANNVQCAGNPFIVVGIGANSYTWQPGNSTTQTSTFSLQSSTTITLSGTGTNGCSGYSYLPIEVHICDGIDEQKNAQTLLCNYDAIQKKITITFPTSTFKNIKLINAEGRLVASRSAFDATVITIPAETFVHGLYYLITESENGVLMQKLLIR